MKSAIMHLQHLSHRKVLDCASPLALSVAPSLTKKRQRTGALQDAVAIAIGRRGLLLGIAISAIGFCAANPANAADFTVHEWGTFTSVQGGDGELLPWRPLQTSDLPDFVHDWTKPGLNRFSLGMLANKGLMVTLQRMETPVIYFHSSESMSVDVSVAFPKGTITEWYPQAQQIGPAFQKPPALVAQLDAGMHKAGVKPEFTFASLLSQHVVKDSRIVWNDVRVLPAKANSEIATQLPLDQSGRHYFAARETDAAFVSVDSSSPTNTSPEHDRFLFYRGVGNFPTPLFVTMSPTEQLTVTNNSPDALQDLFVLRVREGRGQFVHLDRLGASGTMEVAVPMSEKPLTEVAGKLAEEMSAALVSAGLYPREATAMVNTWKDSWFSEDGVRVLYILPRAWTDQTLPMTLKPQPSELVRVMVGRAELLTPATEKRLHESLTRASHGDAAAREQALAELKKLGRFAEPTLQRITEAAANQTGRTLLQLIAQAGAGQGGAGSQNTVAKFE